MGPPRRPRPALLGGSGRNHGLRSGLQFEPKPCSLLAGDFGPHCPFICLLSHIYFKTPLFSASRLLNGPLPGFPRRLGGKESTCQCWRRWFDPWVEEIPWRRKWQSLQYSHLEDPMDRRAWRALVHGVIKSRTLLRTHSCSHICVQQPLYPSRRPHGVQGAPVPTRPRPRTSGRQGCGVLRVWHVADPDSSKWPETYGICGRFYTAVIFGKSVNWCSEFYCPSDLNAGQNYCKGKKSSQQTLSPRFL